MNSQAVVVRPASISDLESIAGIYNQAIDEGLKTADTIHVSLAERMAWFEKLTKCNSCVLVAEYRNGIVGYAYSTPYRNGRPAVSSTVEVSFYVDRSYHRCGIATNLIRQLLSQCQKCGKMNFISVVIDANEASQGILTKFGFREWGRFPKIVEHGGLRFDHIVFGLKTPSKGNGMSPK